MQFSPNALCDFARRSVRALEICLIAIAVPCVPGSFATLAFGQTQVSEELYSTPRLDAPELQIDQVGPQQMGRPQQPGPKEKRENLEDFDLGDRVVPQGSLSPQAIKKIQMELIRRGYDPGSQDGVLGKATREAIRRYQSDRGWPASGRVTIRLLVALHGGDRFEGVAPAPAPGLRGDLMTIEASPLVLKIQDELKRRDYDVSVDGRLDARTVRAIETYQSYVGLEPTGEPSEQLLAHIRSRVIPLNK
jgi:peptidoglycan hydrolase-like protein with peptidoglycan-binding domain